jgi:nicotinate-nucleotide adenylyltransferase
MAESARDQFNLEKVLFITSPMPPHRSKDLMDAASRHAIVEAATADNPYFEPCQIELKRSGPSYTSDTLKELQAQYGEKTVLNLIIGEDNLRYLTQWHEAQTIFQLARILVAPRERVETSAPPTQSEHLPTGARSSFVDFPHVPISGSGIRARLRAGRSVLYMVPPPVNELLLAKGYYLNKQETLK